MPKISVIMPAYNRAHLISQSILSVLTQTFIDFELIIINDGSTDNTEEVVRNFKDPRIKYICQANQGVVAARNTGLNLAQGKYILFLDSDDILLENALKLSVQVLDSYPEVAFTYGQAYLIDELERIFHLRHQAGNDSYVREGIEEIKKAVLNGNYITTSTIMARRSCLVEVGFFNETFRHGSEDFDLWVRMAREHPVAYIAQPLINYRIHDSSISSARRLAELEKSNGIILKRLFDDPKVGPQLSFTQRQAFSHLYLRLADYAYVSRDMTTSRRYMFKALKTYPKWFWKRLFMPVIVRFGKTYLPLKILNLGHKVKHSLLIMGLKHTSKLRLQPVKSHISNFSIVHDTSK